MKHYRYYQGCLQRVLCCFRTNTYRRVERAVTSKGVCLTLPLSCHDGNLGGFCEVLCTPLIFTGKFNAGGNPAMD